MIIDTPWNSIPTFVSLIFPIIQNTLITKSKWICFYISRHQWILFSMSPKLWYTSWKQKSSVLMLSAPAELMLIKIIYNCATCYFKYTLPKWHCLILMPPQNTLYCQRKEALSASEQKLEVKWPDNPTNSNWILAFASSSLHFTSKTVKFGLTKNRNTCLVSIHESALVSMHMLQDSVTSTGK